MRDPSYGHHSSHQLCYNIFGHIDSYVPMDDSHNYNTSLGCASLTILLSVEMYGISTSNVTYNNLARYFAKDNLARVLIQILYFFSPDITFRIIVTMID